MQLRLLEATKDLRYAVKSPRQHLSLNSFIMSGVSEEKVEEINVIYAFYRSVLLRKP